MLLYESIEKLIDSAVNENKKISQIVFSDQAIQMEKSEEEIYAQMEENFDVMCDSIVQGQNPNQKSTSGLTGGEGFKMKSYSEKTSGGLCGDFLTKAMSRALAVAGHNASMGKIVAAPTAGSCGVLPGCLVSLYEDKGMSKKDIVMSMFTAAAFGMVIAKRASLAGADGGCQAEVGSAAGMAAAALVELQGGSPQQSADACAIALSNQLGLVCDPVAGLVEIPCIKRNVAGLMNAFSAADIVLAGIKSEIPVDECIDAMDKVGKALPCSLKETALGGLSITPTGIKLKEKVLQ